MNSHLGRAAASGVGRALLSGGLATILVGAVGLQALAQPPAPRPPEHLSWYGDPSAPDISGVWVRQPSTGSASKEGWTPWPPPLKPAFAAKWTARVEAAKAGTRTDDPIQACLPPGMPRFMTGAKGPLLILQTPGRVMMYRNGDPVRRIWLDGHPFPDAKDLESFSNGNARGRYDGRDLVTEVVGVKDEPIDGTGVPHSDDLKITERYHRVDAGTLRVEVTLTDPTAYDRPMTDTVIYKTLNDPSWEPKEFICTPKTNYDPDAYIH